MADWVETRNGALNLDRAQHIAIEAHRDRPGQYVLVVQMGPVRHLLGEFPSTRAARDHLAELLEFGAVV